MILGEDNRKAWSNMDVLVMHAYQIVQDERCDQCGMPRWLCHNADQRLQVRIKTDYCMAKAEIDKFEESRKKDDDSGAAYPEFYIRPGVEGMDLGDFRALYEEQQAQERAEAQEGE